jgi:hypothetical protein
LDEGQAVLDLDLFAVNNQLLRHVPSFPASKVAV